MKKKLEAELVSIAHRILQLKNKSDIIALHQETQKLYEKLSVLRFVEESFGESKPTIGSADFRNSFDSYFEDSNASADVKLTDNDEIETLDAKSADSNELNSAEQVSTDSEKIEEEPAYQNQSEEEEEEEESATEVQNNEQEDDDESENETNSTVDLESDETENEDESEETESEKESENEEETKNEEGTEKLEETAVGENQESETDESDSQTEAEADEIEETPQDIPPTVIEPESKVELEVAEADEKKDMTAESNTSKEDFFVPSFELAFDPKSDDLENIEKIASPQFSFDDLLGKDYSDPVFEKLGDELTAAKAPIRDFPTYNNTAAPKSVSLNDRLSKGITIGLNDRIAFIKHLFGDSSEDYNRVLSQLMTFGTYDEASTFIEDMVKPDYNDWKGKDEYEERFMDFVQRRFS